MVCIPPCVPEIWLNYGESDVVLDIRAENLEQNVGPAGGSMEDADLSERLASSLDMSRPVELAVLHNTRSTRKVISALYAICEQKSLQFPRITADRGILGAVRSGLPEGSAISEFDGADLSAPNLVFVGEIELDGLFGFETVSTRLMRRFGGENMLAAYAKRKGNLPAPGQPTESIREAKRFADGFEITGIEIVANPGGVVDVSVGHPSQTMGISRSLEHAAVRDVGRHKAVIASTGKGASNDTLGRSLSSLWGCHCGVRPGGMAVLLAECGGGLGHAALMQFVEGRLGADRLQSPPRYVDGMEGLLYLTEVQKSFQVGIVSTLPELYVKKLNMVPLGGAGSALEHILKAHGPRQKVVVVPDGARTLLR